MPMPRLVSGRGPFSRANTSTTILLLWSTHLPGQHMNCFIPTLDRWKWDGHALCSATCWLLCLKEMYMAKLAIALPLGVTLGIISADEDIMCTARRSSASAPIKYCDGMKTGSNNAKGSQRTRLLSTIPSTTSSSVARPGLYYLSSYGAHRGRRICEPR